MKPKEYNFIDYLKAKISVDDEALNRQVWDRLHDWIAAQPTEEDLRILEVGGGIGTMLPRMLSAGLLPSCTYTMVDLMAENIDYAFAYLTDWGREHDYQVEVNGEHAFILSNAQTIVKVELMAEEVYGFLARQTGQYDLLVAHAFLDLFVLDEALPRLFSILRPDGGYYFTINYDGETAFSPALPGFQEEHILRLYNGLMDANAPGGRHTSRRLFEHLYQIGAEILSSGSSAWVVFPSPDGYRAQQAYFLHFIIDLIEGALQNHLEVTGAVVTAWAAERHAQIERKQLVYIAYQLDFFGVGTAASLRYNQG